MKVINSIQAFREWRNSLQGQSVALVPTMGYLHDGHLSLIRKARPLADKVVVSIYVNPTQFAPGEDLEAYPRDFNRDEHLCEDEKVDCIFYPSNSEMYTTTHQTYVTTEDLSTLLCGKSRPTHFRGVTTIVAKLFNIVQPQVAVFGQKDAQQALIIKRMVEDLNFPVQIHVAPIVREADGLAMSSRNKYLSAEERSQAPVLYQALQLAQEGWHRGQSIDNLRAQVSALIASSPLAEIDYVEFSDAATLQPVREASGPVLLALAVRFGSTRLIDNIILE